MCKFKLNNAQLVHQDKACGVWAFVCQLWLLKGKLNASASDAKGYSVCLDKMQGVHDKKHLNVTGMRRGPASSPFISTPLSHLLLPLVLLLPFSTLPLFPSSVSQPAVWQRCRVWWRLPGCQHISTQQHTHMHTFIMRGLAGKAGRTQHGYIILLNSHAFILLNLSRRPVVRKENCLLIHRSDSFDIII